MAISTHTDRSETMRSGLIASMIDSISKSSAAGFPMTVEAAEFALIVTLTPDERAAVEEGLR
jgi:hypothetical protein